MAEIDILSFKCLDEQDGPNLLGSDEIYAVVQIAGGEDRRTSTSLGVDAGETHNASFRNMIFGDDGVALISLYERDRGESGRGRDDLLGSVAVQGDDAEGARTVTLTTSEAKYELTYQLWT